MKKSTRVCLQFAVALSISIVGGVLYASQSLHLSHHSQKKGLADSMPTRPPVINKHLGLREKGKQNSHTNVCQSPVTNITYLKIHKTGSSTLAKIFNRFGYLRNLSFLLPKDVKCGRGYVWEMESASSVRADSLKFSEDDGTGVPYHYSLFTLHSTYNREVLDELMAPGSLYIASLREPVGQFESAFGFFKFELALPTKVQNLDNIENKMREWFKDPQYYKRQYEIIVRDGKLLKSSESYLYSRNGQIRDLGFDMEHQEDRKIVSDYIAKLDRDFDFILIMEYFDESLLLMKKQFCWSTEDILYIPENQRPEKMKSSSLPWDITESIQCWNAADQQLYAHFNHTFWRRMRAYGPSFESDLAEFRIRLKEVFDACISEQVDKEKYARIKYIHRKHAPGYCTLLAMSKNELMEKIRERYRQS